MRLNTLYTYQNECPHNISYANCYSLPKIILLELLLLFIINLSSKHFTQHPKNSSVTFRFTLVTHNSLQHLLYFDPRPGPKMLFQGDTPEGSDTFQWPVIERDRVGGLRFMIWDNVKVPLCHYSDAPEESNL